jgi:hypothetical protein
MHQEDARHVRNFAERHAQAEALAAHPHPHPQGVASEAQDSHGAGAGDGTAADDGCLSGAEAGGQAAEAAPLLDGSHSKSGKEGKGGAEQDDGRGNCAVLPWWLPPERIPPAVSGAEGRWEAVAAAAV